MSKEKPKLNIDVVMGALLSIYDVKVESSPVKNIVLIYLIDSDDEVHAEGEGATFSEALAACAMDFAQSESEEANRLRSEAMASLENIAVLRKAGLEVPEG